MARHNNGSYVLLFAAITLWMRISNASLSTDYAVDTFSVYSSTTGFLSLTQLNFAASVHTIEIRILARANSQCIMSMGVAGLDNFFAIQIESDSSLAVRVGFPNLPNFAYAVSASGSIPLNTWHTISVVVTSLNSTNSHVSAFMDGNVLFFNALLRQFPSGTRQGVFIGKCQENTLIEHPQGPQTLNGVVDNFRVWNRARTQAEIQATISAVDIDKNLTSVINNQNLVAVYSFNEGRGLVSRDVKNGGEATLGETSWIVKDFGTIYRTCYTYEDASSFYITLPAQDPTYIAPPNLVGQWQMSSCGPNFAVRVFRAPVRAWDLGEGCEVRTCGPTINNAVTVKAFDDVFYITTLGHLFIAKFPNGLFVNQTAGSGVRPSGVRYNYTQTSLSLQVPTVGWMNITTMPLGRGGIFADAYIYHTAYCEAHGFGLCYKNDTRVTWSQFLFGANESFCGDQVVSGTEQCDGTARCLSSCTCSIGLKSELGLCVDDCGNGVVTGAEQCDSSQSCTNECMCTPGTRSENGKCVDECDNGIVTGAEQCDGGSFCEKCKCLDGFKPTSPPSQSCEGISSDFVPRVIPTLDCLELNGLVARLHFSYENLDGFRQVIERGKYNNFTPESVATSRPTVFSAGRSLTYPLSPYSTNITTSIGSFTWILGSFNLTVDLTNPSGLLCPKVPEIEIVLTTPANLTSGNVQTIIDNLADMYDIDPSRINVTVVVNATTQPPTYTLIIAIGNPTNITERDPVQVISDLFTDLKENEDETKANLTEGLEDIEAEIKEISTRPTGVEVRGQPTGSNGGDSVGEPLQISVAVGLSPLFSLLFVLYLLVV